MTYEIRDEIGSLRAAVSNSYAGQIIDKFSGKWVEKKFVGNPTKENIYIFSQGFIYESSHMKITFLPGFYMRKSI